MKVQTSNVFTVEEYERDGKTQKRWTKIGAAFPHKEGIGFSIELKAFPIDGRLLVARSRIARARKVFAAALGCALNTPPKPWVAIRGYPSNACVQPRDGFTGAPSQRPGKQMTLHPSRRLGKQMYPRLMSPFFY